MSSRSENLSELRRIVSPAIRKAVVPAVKAGQEVLRAGMVRRCPKDTRRLASTIHATKVGVGRYSAGGAVVVGTRYALAVEYGPHRRPFVGPTKHQDGPKAEAAMAKELLSRLKG
jgi:hypothetical protein